MFCSSNPAKQDHPIGEASKDALRVDFDPKLNLEFCGAKVTGDAGLLAYRKLDEVMQLTCVANERLMDSRTGQNTQHSMTALLGQSTCGRLAGYESANNADRLCMDPAMGQIVGDRAKERTAALTSQMAPFETEILALDENLQVLRNLPGIWVGRVQHRKSIDRIVLDLDSSVSETYGNQEGSACNGHFGCECCHPLFCFNQFGDVERAMLRNGNLHSADDWQTVLIPVIDQYREVPKKFFCGDGAAIGQEVKWEIPLGGNVFHDFS